MEKREIYRKKMLLDASTCFWFGLLCWMFFWWITQLPLNNPQQNYSQAVKERKKRKKKQKKAMGNLHTNAGHTWTWHSNAFHRLIGSFWKLGRDSSKRDFLFFHVMSLSKNAFSNQFRDLPEMILIDKNFWFCFILQVMFFCVWKISGNKRKWCNIKTIVTVYLRFLLSSEPSATFWIAGWMLFNKQNVVQFMFQWGCFTDLKNISSTRSITTDENGTDTLPVPLSITIFEDGTSGTENQPKATDSPWSTRVVKT